ncbi:hypothetical protein AAFC00_000844 [Neodothiora populina]|uniref:Uncharacterized protein n=1 Tax=Neodothiora populina TaxID=2781224 RepID=A0ABR3PLZ9_9PEZI
MTDTVQLYGLLNYLNMKASKLSTQDMEGITKDMHKLARETQQETVSMRIITFITLIFLPGTFVSTIMSTDIVTWDTNGVTNKAERIVYVGAVKFFMALTFPLIVLTLAVWALLYSSERRGRSPRQVSLSA